MININNFSIIPVISNSGNDGIKIFPPAVRKMNVFIVNVVNSFIDTDVTLTDMVYGTYVKYRDISISSNFFEWAIWHFFESQCSNITKQQPQ